ncbi:MAG: hypothetical protein WBD91_10035, partial [Acidobacteriaceae bacterium]
MSVRFTDSFASSPVVSAPVHLRPNLLLFWSALVLFFCISGPSLVAQTPTPITVPTWRYDLTHSGENTQETA